MVNTLYPLAIFPYISRILSVSSIGTYNYYNILFAYISLFASFGISLYASRELGKYKDDNSSRNKLTSELFFISIFNGLLTLLFIAFPLILFTKGTDQIIAIIFSLMIVANSISVEWYYVATENQKYIFFRNFFFKVISVILIFYLVKSDNDLILYVLIVVLGLLLNAIVNFIKLFFSIKGNLNFKFSFSHYKGLFAIFLVEITYRYFGMGDVTLLEKFVTREELGFLTFALSIFNIISSFLKIIATTLLPRVSFMIHTKNYKDFYRLLTKSNSLIFLISLPAMLCLFFGANTLATLFGGEKFGDATNLIKAFCPLILITSIINTIVFQILYPLGKTKLIILIYITNIFINIVLNLVLIPYISSYSLIVSAIISNLLVLVSLFFLERKTLVFKNLFSVDIFKYLVSFVFAGTLMYIMAINNIDKYNITAILSGSIIYISIIILMKDSIVYKFLSIKYFNHEK